MRANTILAVGMALLVGILSVGCGGSDDNNTVGSSNPPASFSISLSQTSGTVLVESNLSGYVQASAPDGFTGSVNLSAVNLPAGVTAVFNPPTISFPGVGSSAFTLVVQAGTTPVAGYAVTILANGTGIDSQAVFSLTVQAGASPVAGFRLDLSTASVSLSPGGSADATVILTAEEGFAGQVALALTGLPSGVTATFTPASPTLGATPVSVGVHLSADASAAVSTTPVTANLSAQGSGSSQSAPLAVTVLSPGDPLAARSNVLNAVKDYYAAQRRQGIRGLAAVQAVAAFMASQPEFISSGMDSDTDTAWGTMKDGATVIVGSNWPFSPPGTVAATPLSLASGTMNQPVSKATTLSFSGAGLPTPAYARVMHAWQTGSASPDTYSEGFANTGGATTLGEIKDYLSGKGYSIRTGEASFGEVSSLKKVQGDGFFLFNGHGGREELASLVGVKGAPKRMAMSTSTPRSAQDDATYADDLMKGRLVYWVGDFGNYFTSNVDADIESRYGITSEFVEEYMSFAPDSVVMLMVCFSGNTLTDFVNSYIKKGAGAVVSSKIELNTEHAYTAYKYFVDRLLGANKFRAETPPQRPFPADLVWADMDKKNLLNDTVPNAHGQLNKLILTLKNPDLPPILSPSIQSLAVNEQDEKLVLVGFFGGSSSSGMPGAMVTVDGLPLTCPDWAPGKIVCNLPAPGKPASKGMVIVELPGGAVARKSNPRWLTQWDIPIKFTWADVLGHKNWKLEGNGMLRFRGDVGNYRVEPGIPPTFPIRGMYATKDSFLNVTGSGTDTKDTGSGYCIQKLSGEGTFKPGQSSMLSSLMRADTLTKTGGIYFQYASSPSHFTNTATGTCAITGSNPVPALMATLLEGMATYPSPLADIPGPSDPLAVSVSLPALNINFDSNFNILGRSYTESHKGVGPLDISFPDVVHQPVDLQNLSTPR